MLVPLKWLSEFVDHGLSAPDLAHALTMGGLEVDGVIQRYQGLGGKVITAKVLRVEPHPDADKLRLAHVDTGGGQDVIVCGAPNLREGMVGALATIGAELGEGFKVKKAKIRGVKSNGMLCSAKELGISEDHSGILDLDESLEPGLDVVEALGLETEVLEISITPNRGDALSVLGVARDVAAITGKPLRRPEISFTETGPAITDDAEITVSDPAGCPRYTARMVRNVKIAPGPLWMADRLSASGVRPISNVVDVTNYVLLEVGQPLHAFDYATLADGRIDVRTARPGEVFTTLDGQERKLEDGMLLICDGQRPVGLAGVMGGLNSEITDQTKDVLIESAFFDPLTIRRTSKRLNLPTEAAYRFERGVDRDGCLLANDRAAQLMADFCGGEIAAGFIDVHHIPYQAPRLGISTKKASVFLGVGLEQGQAAGMLEGLGLKVEKLGDGDGLVVEPPAFRTDLERPVDLTEELARLVAYDNIPTAPPVAPMTARARAWDRVVREQARDLMAAQGFDEAITLSFAHPKAVRDLGFEESDPRTRVVKIMNPLSEDQSVLRTSLLPGLLASLRRNISHRVADIALFEVGKVFWDRPGEKQPLEPMRLMGLIHGLAAPVSWWSAEAPVSLAHIRGAVGYLLQGLGIKDASFVEPQSPSPYLTAGQCLGVRAGGKAIGEFGRLDPKLAAAYEAEKPVYVLELDFDLVVEMAPPGKRYHQLPKYPEVVRDIALVVDEGVGAGEVLAEAKGAKWLDSVEIFDIYRGKPLEKGQKSLGLRFHYRNQKRTLTFDEVTPIHDKMIQGLLERFQASIRR